MTTIKLPPLPKDMLHTILKLCDEYATAAVELDRAQRGEPVLWRYRDSEQCIRPMDGYTPGDGWTPLYDNPQPEREHTEGEVQALLNAREKLATMRYSDGEFEQYVRHLLGVPKP